MSQYANFLVCLCETPVTGCYALLLYCYPSSKQPEVDKKYSIPYKGEGKSKEPVCVGDKIEVLPLSFHFVQGSLKKGKVVLRFCGDDISYNSHKPVFVSLDSKIVPTVKFFKGNGQKKLLCEVGFWKTRQPSVQVPVTEGIDQKMVPEERPACVYRNTTTKRQKGRASNTPSKKEKNEKGASQKTPAKKPKTQPNKRKRSKENIVKGNCSQPGPQVKQEEESGSAAKKLKLDPIREPGTSGVSSTGETRKFKGSVDSSDSESLSTETDDSDSKSEGSSDTDGDTEEGDLAVKRKKPGRAKQKESLSTETDDSDTKSNGSSDTDGDTEEVDLAVKRKKPVGAKQKESLSTETDDSDSKSNGSSDTDGDTEEGDLAVKRKKPVGSKQRESFSTDTDDSDSKSNGSSDTDGDTEEGDLAVKRKKPVGSKQRESLSTETDDSDSKSDGSSDTDGDTEEGDLAVKRKKPVGAKQKVSKKTTTKKQNAGPSNKANKKEKNEGASQKIRAKKPRTQPYKRKSSEENKVKVKQEEESGSAAKNPKLEPTGELGSSEVSSTSKTRKFKVEDGGLKDRDLSDIAEEITEKYRRLGRALGVPQKTLDKVAINHKDDAYERAFQVLWWWKKNVCDGTSSSYQTLLKALTKIGHRDLANEYSLVLSKRERVINR